MDRYSKVVLTAIAFALFADLFIRLAGDWSLIPSANAQAGAPTGYTRVVIVGAQAVDSIGQYGRLIPMNEGLPVMLLRPKYNVPVDLMGASDDKPITVRVTSDTPRKPSSSNAHK